MISGRKHYTDIYHNVKIKQYPSGLERYTICSKAIFRDSGYELAIDKPKEPKPQNTDNESRTDSTKRAKETVFDISMLNKFDYFITWTLSAEQINRYDPQEISKKLKTFLNNMQKRYNLRYIIIPERHKDGAIHMHGLISGDMKYVDSDRRLIPGNRFMLQKETIYSQGLTDESPGVKIIYNMPQWKYGWSTAIETYGDQEHVARYITKYITKSFHKIFGNFTMRVGILSANQMYA